MEYLTFALMHGLWNSCQVLSPQMRLQVILKSCTCRLFLLIQTTQPTKPMNHNRCPSRIRIVVLHCGAHQLLVPTMHYKRCWLCKKHVRFQHVMSTLLQMPFEWLVAEISRICNPKSFRRYTMRKTLLLMHTLHVCSSTSHRYVDSRFETNKRE